jgi:hypothetical protein
LIRRNGKLCSGNLDFDFVFITLHKNIVVKPPPGCVSGSARVSRVGFGVSPKRSLLVYAHITLSEMFLKEKSVKAGRMRYPITRVNHAAYLSWQPD